jgi:subtilase family serine protease
LALALPGAASAQGRDDRRLVEAVRGGLLITPGASRDRLEMRGQAAHTNLHIFRPDAAPDAASSPVGYYETPGSLACVYGLAAMIDGCNPQTAPSLTKGGSHVIAIVDAYDDPNAAADLASYSKQFGLPEITKKNFEVVYAAGQQPAQDSSGGWELEESLDIEMAHALAPRAKIILVEAASNNLGDLFGAEQVAIGLVQAAGGGEISNSWTGAEFSFEAGYQSAFTGTKVVVFASAGDQPGVGVPSAMPNVVSVGGTSINRSSTGAFLGQTTWSQTGGGLSAYVPVPGFQSRVAKVVGAQRGTPDIAMVANPSTGVWVYDSLPYDGAVPNWIVVGGTSVASPVAAALVNNAGAFRASTQDELDVIYANLGKAKNFTDITSGVCGNGPSGSATVGYDLCTGIGAPLGRYGK